MWRFGRGIAIAIDMATDTRSALLAAAEMILVEQGVNALSVRKVGSAAGINPTLVTYHFKSILMLLDELCSLNLDPMISDWQVIGSDSPEGQALDLDGVLAAWLGPLLRPAAFTQGGRALAVLDEISAHSELALRSKVLAAMNAFGARLYAAVAPLVPDLSEPEIRARLRFISGSALGPPPHPLNNPPTDGVTRLDDLKYLLPFARAALSN